MSTVHAMCIDTTFTIKRYYSSHSYMRKGLGIFLENREKPHVADTCNGLVPEKVGSSCNVV